MFSEIRAVYNLLEDDESKDIFLNRILFNVTGKGEYIDKIVSHYFERMKKEWKSQKHVDEIQKLREKIADREVIIYGIGNCGFVTLALFKSVLSNVPIKAFCDKNVNGGWYHGYKVVNIKELSDGYKDTVVLITPVKTKFKEEIVSELTKYGFDEKQIVRQMPFDDWTIRGQYFDEKVLLGKDVFVDAGAYDCGTDIDFIRRCPDYKEIIAFEPDPVSYDICKAIAEKINNMSIYNVGLWDKTDVSSFSMGGAASHVSDIGTAKIQLDSLDHILSGKRVSFIKMDIEGAELKALQGGCDTIVKCRPKLAICVYHKPNDIIEIPSYIHKIVPQYKLYLRHHSQNANETVLYAIAD